MIVLKKLCDIRLNDISIKMVLFYNNFICTQINIRNRDSIFNLVISMRLSNIILTP